MRRILATAAMGAMLALAPALAQASPGVIPAVGAPCPAALASTIQGTLVGSAVDSLTMTVDGGTGPLLAFGAVRLRLPIAPNATVLGSPQKGDTVIVRVFSCPNTDKTALTMVAGRIAVKPKTAPKKPIPRKPVAGKKTKR
jgi:hypothetical protein